MKCVLIVALAVAVGTAHCYPEDYDPVCASDGSTYYNEEVFNNDLEKDSSVTINFYGTCHHSDWDEHVCQGITRHVMCGSDGINYENDCLFDFAVRRNPSLRWRFGGVCQKYFINDRICGTDGVVYNVPKFLSEQSVRPHLGHWPMKSCTGDYHELQTPIWEAPTFCGTDLLIYEDPIFEAQQALRPDLGVLPLSDCYYKPYFQE